MTIVVEDGTGLSTANSYVSEDEADAYFDDRANDTWANSTADKEAALIRATQSLDVIYWTRFSGTKLNGRDQALQWPRTGATDVLGNVIDSDEIPVEIKQATFELAVREAVTPGSTDPDLERAVQHVAAGSVQVTFAANASD